MTDLRQRKAAAAVASSTESTAPEEKLHKQPAAVPLRDWIDELGVSNSSASFIHSRSSIIQDILFRYDPKTVITVLLLTLCSLLTRFWNIGKANFVVWDEAHFGKFASYYLRRQFYFDVHPPLGKMLVAFAGALAQYHGDFDFESGKVYPEGLNYSVMRMFLALFGVMLVPLAYLTMFELGFRRRTCLLAAVMILFENALCTISRYILLDSMLLYFTAQTLYCLAVFRSHQSVSFSWGWWFWLCATGVSIGCVYSVKWVGFFVTALVGLYTIEDLWVKLGDLRMPVVRG